MPLAHAQHYSNTVYTDTKPRTKRGPMVLRPKQALHEYVRSVHIRLGADGPGRGQCAPAAFPERRPYCIYGSRPCELVAAAAAGAVAPTSRRQLGRSFFSPVCTCVSSCQDVCPYLAGRSGGQAPLRLRPLPHARCRAQRGGRIITSSALLICCLRSSPLFPLPPLRGSCLSLPAILCSVCVFSRTSSATARASNGARFFPSFIGSCFANKS